MVRLTGYSRESLIGTSFKEYFTEPERAAAGVRQTLNEGSVTNYELLLRSRHRREFLVSFNASVFKDMEGNVQGIFAVARDVTEQRRLEEQLRESQIYNRGLIESSIDALVTVDPDLTITDVNEQMVKLTGYTRDELIGSAFKEYFTEPRPGRRRRAADPGHGFGDQLRTGAESRTGKRTVVSFNAGTFKDTAGQVGGIFAAAREITEQKRLEEQLREQQNYNRSLIESSVDALLTVDPNGIIADVNEQTVKLTGYQPQATDRQPLHRLFHRSRDWRARASTRPSAKGGDQLRAGVAHQGRAQDSGFLQRRGFSRYQRRRRRHPGRRPREHRSKRKSSSAMREQQAYTRSLIESNIDALMTTDTLGVITDVNRPDVRAHRHDSRRADRQRPSRITSPTRRGPRTVSGGCWPRTASPTMS